LPYSVVFDYLAKIGKLDEGMQECRNAKLRMQKKDFM
jgi:hypothetical protein